MAKDTTEIAIGPSSITIDGNDVDLKQVDSVSLTMTLNTAVLKSDDYGETPIAVYERGDEIMLKFGAHQWDQSKILAYMPSGTASGSYAATFGRAPGNVIDSGEVVVTVPGRTGTQQVVWTIYKAAVRFVDDITIGGEVLAYGVEVVGMIDSSRSANDLLYKIDTTAAVATAPGPPSRSTPAGDSDVAIDTTVVWAFGSDVWDVIRKEFLTTDYFKLFDVSSGSAAEVACTLSYDSAQQTVTLTPDSDLTNSTVYLATVSELIKNQYGVKLAAQAASSFTTVAL